MNARILQLLIYIVLLLVGVRTAFKVYGNYKERTLLVHEFKELTSEASFYRQFDQAGAERVLLKCLAVVEDAREGGMSLEELYERVYGDDDNFDKDRNKGSLSSAQERLVRNTLDHAYLAAKDLGILEREHMESLREGRMPSPSMGKPVIVPLIDPEIAPGMDKVVPNLEIRPLGADVGSRTLTSIEVAAVRRLAKSLSSAKLIEDQVEDLILNHYQTNAPEEPDSSGSSKAGK